MRDNSKKFWITFVLLVLLVDVLLIGLWTFLDVRTREFVSNEQVTFPLRQGWIVQIRTGAEEATLEAADDAYFYLKRQGVSAVEEILLTATPEERPVDYEAETYFYLEETIPADSDWIVMEASFAEGRVKPSVAGEEVQVRTSATKEVINSSAWEKTGVLLLLSAWVCIIVGIVKS
jgi:hypothetical protein